MTILFAEDWAHYPQASLHLETKNTSFIRLAQVYRGMGVKNYSFILALHNPLLRDIDPHSTSLTLEEQAMVQVECKMNIWYFFREVLRVPARGGAEAGLYEANRGNIALIWLFMNHITVILIQIRQTGKSLTMQSTVVWLILIACLNTKVCWLTKDDHLRRDAIQSMKDIIEELPPYLDLRDRTDAQNGEEITVNKLKNKVDTFVPQSSEKRALNQGRGHVTPIIIGDEGPFQVNFDISFPAALGAMGAAVDKAKEADAPWGVILGTTAGKKDTREGKFFFDKYLNPAMEYSEFLFDAINLADLDRIIRMNSSTGECQVNVTMNHRQLGKSDEWLKNVLERVKPTPDAADRDYFNRWTSGSNSIVLPVEIMESMRNGMRVPDHHEISTAGYVVRWYVPKEEIEARMNGVSTIMSMDTSEASGGDDISLVITDVETGETLAAGTYNHTNLHPFVEWLTSLLVRWPRMTAIIERRSTGSSVLDLLMYWLPTHGIDPFKRLFNRCVNDAEDDKERFREISTPMGRRDPEILTRMKKTFGFATSGTGMASRSDLYSTTLQAAAFNVGMKAADKKIIDQTLSLEIISGRVDHPKGEHDDMVIGWLLGHWLLSKGKNLTHYGIDPKRVYMKMLPEKPMNQREQWIAHEQQVLRDKIQQTMEALANEVDEFVIVRMEHDLRVLTKKVILEVGDVFSVDEMIRQLRETRSQRKRQNANPQRYAKSSAPVSQDRVYRDNTIREYIQSADSPDPYSSQTPFGRFRLRT